MVGGVDAPFTILLGPYLDKSYIAAGKMSGKFISRAKWMIRIGWGQNSLGRYLPPLPLEFFEEGGGGDTVNLVSRSSHATREMGQSRERWKRHRWMRGSIRYFFERRRTAEREGKLDGLGRVCKLGGAKYLLKIYEKKKCLKDKK